MTLKEVSQDSGHCPKVLDFKKCLESALRNKVCVLDGPVWSQELYVMTVVCPFQLRRFYDSMKRKHETNLIPKNVSCIRGGKLRYCMLSRN